MLELARLACCEMQGQVLYIHCLENHLAKTKLKKYPKNFLDIQYRAKQHAEHSSPPAQTSFIGRQDDQWTAIPNFFLNFSRWAEQSTFYLRLKWEHLLLE